MNERIHLSYILFFKNQGTSYIIGLKKLSGHQNPYIKFHKSTEIIYSGRKSVVARLGGEVFNP